MKRVLFILLVFTLMSFTEEKTHKASYYGGHHHGRVTASGEIFDKNLLTCASTKEYKFGDILEVTNVKNGKSVIVKVNDRGAFAKYGRTLDLSEEAFRRIAPLKQGVVRVTIKKIEKDLYVPK